MDQTEACIQLWAAVFNQGLSDIAAAFKRRENPYTSEPLRWLNSGNTSVGSFLWLCGIFGLEPELVRAKVGERYECRN